ALVARLNRPDSSLSAAGAAGLYVKWNLGEHAFALNVSDVGTAGAFVRTPITVGNNGTDLFINGELTLLGLEARQVGLSYAYPFFDGALLLGATAKVIRGLAYVDSARVDEGDDDIDILKGLKDPKKSSAYSV